jgi:hypothetical protein
MMMAAASAASSSTANDGSPRPGHPRWRSLGVYSVWSGYAFIGVKATKMITGPLRLPPDQSPGVPAGYETAAVAGSSRLTSSQPGPTSTRWWERPSAPTPPETAEADQLPARVPTVPQPILGDAARMRRSRKPAPYTTAIYLSPDHMHLAVVLDYGKLSVYKLDGQRFGEKVAQ